MDGIIQSMCERYVHDSIVITRMLNRNTSEFAGNSTELGTDRLDVLSRTRPNTPAKFCASPAGMRRRPILVLCPIHPFVWPVKASIANILHGFTTGAYRDAVPHRLFFESGRKVDRNNSTIFPDLRTQRSIPAAPSRFFRFSLPWSG